MLAGLLLHLAPMPLAFSSTIIVCLLYVIFNIKINTCFVKLCAQLHETSRNFTRKSEIDDLKVVTHTASITWKNENYFPS
jgi:hypothetical protein